MTTVPNVTSRRVEKRRKCMNSVKKTQDHRLDPQPPRLYKMFVRIRTPVPPFSVVDRQKSPFHYEITLQFELTFKKVVFSHLSE